MWSSGTFYIMTFFAILFGISVSYYRCNYNPDFLKRWITISRPTQWEWWVSHTLPNIFTAIMMPRRLTVYIIRVTIVETALMYSHYCKLKPSSFGQVAFGSFVSILVYWITCNLKSYFMT